MSASAERRATGEGKMDEAQQTTGRGFEDEAGAIQTYIADMCAELAALAAGAEMKTLAHILRMAQLEAEHRPMPGDDRD